MTMIERVARAINPFAFTARREIDERQSTGERLDLVWIASVDGQIIHALAQARQAIEAMREPTDVMLKAPNSIMGGGFQNSHSDRETWDAMIAAALGETMTAQKAA